jgi:hypothetical protein
VTIDVLQGITMAKMKNTHTCMHAHTHVHYDRLYVIYKFLIHCALNCVRSRMDKQGTRNIYLYKK